MELSALRVIIGGASDASHSGWLPASDAFRRKPHRALTSHFGRFGIITDAHVPLSKETGLPQGYGFITFKDEAAAVAAVRASPHVIDGSDPLVVRAASAPRNLNAASPPAAAVPPRSPSATAPTTMPAAIPAMAPAQAPPRWSSAQPALLSMAQIQAQEEEERRLREAAASVATAAAAATMPPSWGSAQVAPLSMAQIQAHEEEERRRREATAVAAAIAQPQRPAASATSAVSAVSAASALKWTSLEMLLTECQTGTLCLKLDGLRMRSGVSTVAIHQGTLRASGTPASLVAFNRLAQVSGSAGDQGDLMAI